MLESLYCTARREFLDASYRSWSMCSCSECRVFLTIVQNQHQFVLLSYSFVLLLENIVCVKIAPNKFLVTSRRFRDKNHTMFTIRFDKHSCQRIPWTLEKSRNKPTWM